MKRTVSAMEARKKLGELLEGVYYRGDEVVIERAGKPMAVVVPGHVYEAVEKQRADFWAAIDRVHERNKDVPPEIIEADIEAVIREVRSRRRSKRTA